MKAIVSITFIVLLYGINSVPISAIRICASRKKNNENFPLKQNTPSVPEDFLNDSNIIHTAKNDNIKFETCTNFCHALWQEEKTANGTKIIILSQGCWKQSGEQKCETTECIALQSSTKALNNTKFCCCHGDYCNLNINSTNTLYSENNAHTSISAENNQPTTQYLEQSDSGRWIVIITSVLLCILLVICIIALMIYRIYHNNMLARLGKPLSYTDQFMDSTALRTGTYTVDHLKLTTIVGQGRYGSVWQGSMGDQDVAVKIFPSHYRNYFQNERDTYCLPFMEHSSLLSYYGVDERVSMEGSVEYLLVLSFAPGGTLTDFLRTHMIDWITFCKMGLSMVKGLAYLHTDIHKGDKFKPCIAHRDINSRNILIKADGTCCICDLGLAVQISGSKYYSNGEAQHAEIKSINDVGTLRYMAPEILEGAVNLRDCESSLKQIDVYAMGLVIWELVSRCSDIYVLGSEVPPYRQPYEKEIGLHPTFEQMQVLVSRNKARPLLEGNLVDRPGVRLIKETMEDCWDADAEARLTALCIEERLSELQSHRVTIHFTDGSPMVNSHCTLVPSTTNSLYSESSHHDNIHVTQFISQAAQDNSSNEGGVVENLVTLSPSRRLKDEWLIRQGRYSLLCFRVYVPEKCNMAMVASNMSGHIQKQLTRSLERILEEAHLSGELKLSGRKLKDFPKVGKTGSSKYNLQDTVIADLSKNRFAELPEEVTEFLFLEKLHLYHNAIRIIPETVVMLQSLNYLDLSRNQLTSLPREICRLPLQTLLVAHNRLASLPDELGRMSALAELDAGCNEITNLPPRMGDLARLRSLDLRSNMIVHLPIELTYLRLVKLDISGNRISVLPNEMRKMKSLVDFRLSDNPLTSPPASLCIRGRTHIFKYLERQAAKHERARGGRARRTPLDVRGHATLDTRTHRRHNVDSGYSTSDGVDKRWSQEIHSAVHDGEIRGLWRQECSPLSITLPHETGVNGSCSGTSTPSTISPGEHTSLEDELGKAMILHDQLEKRKLERSTSENGADVRRPMTSGFYHASITPPGPLESAHLNQTLPVSTNTQSVQPLQTSTSNATSLMNGDEKRPLNHIQTYREYKEALRQQRANEGPSVYRPREQVTPPGNESQNNAETADSASNKDAVALTGKQIFNEENATKRPVQKVTPSRINYQNTPIINGSNNEYNNKNGKYLEQPYKKPNSPIKTSSSILSSNTSPGHTPRLVKTAVGYVEGNKSPNRNGGSPKSPRSVTWNSNVPEKYSFTMRREFERAKEEADLIEQLRNHIETRLKMALPEDLAPALTDGVVLCHLANHVRPRSVASIHVPSPAVPKLTMARCRRNVDNFLEACRKIGVDENLVCCASDVLEGGRGVVRVAVTVSELLRFHQSRSPLQTTSSSNVPNHVSA